MRSEEQQLREQLAQGCGCRTKEQLKAENEALRVIVADVHWMARRYADGRSSYAPGMFNSRVKELLGMGVELCKPHYARDGMGRKFDGLTEEEVRAAEEDMPKAYLQQVKEAEERIAKLGSEFEALRAFARDIIDSLWEGAGTDLDGAEVQEAAVKHGLITETIATAEDLAGSNYPGDVGEPWFKYADWMNRASSAGPKTQPHPLVSDV